MQRRRAKSPRGVSGRRATGTRGATGPRGAAGPAGPIGPATSAADILAVVDDQFSAMRKQIDVQVTRTAQVQRELDALRKDTAELRRELADVHGLVKDLVKTSV
jgi:hypothetical protein